MAFEPEDKVSVAGTACVVTKVLTDGTYNVKSEDYTLGNINKSEATMTDEDLRFFGNGNCLETSPNPSDELLTQETTNESDDVEQTTE